MIAEMIVAMIAEIITRTTAKVTVETVANMIITFPLFPPFCLEWINSCRHRSCMIESGSLGNLNIFIHVA